MIFREITRGDSVKQQANFVYRFALPINASASQRRQFRHRLELIKSANPNLVIIPDWSQQNEDEAFVAFRKDKDYNKRRAAYLAAASLSRSLFGLYVR